MVRASTAKAKRTRRGRASKIERVARMRESYEPKPLRVTKAALRRFEAELLSAIDDPHKVAAYRALPEGQRLESLRRYLEERFTDAAREAHRESRAAARRTAEAIRASFIAGWRLAEAHLAVLETHRDAILDEADDAFRRVKARKAAAPLTEDDLAEVTAVMSMLEETEAIAIELEAAMTVVAESAGVLEATLDRWTSAERWAAGRILGDALRSQPSNPVTLRAVARSIGVPVYKLLRAIDAHGGDLAADGAMKAAAAIVGELTQRSSRTIERGPAVGKRFFLRLAGTDVGPDTDSAGFGLYVANGGGPIARALGTIPPLAGGRRAKKE